MKKLHGEIRLSATDVSNHLACRHLTELELSALRGERRVPQWAAPDIEVIRQLGERHEAKYLKLVEEKVATFLNLRDVEEGKALDQTRRAMEAGVDAIAQGALRHGRWFGRPDVLRKIKGKPSRFGDWSYEAYDCKLSKETKATTILQLSFYSELLGEILRLPDAARPSSAPDPKSKSKSGESQTAFDFEAAQVPVAVYLPEFMWVVPPGKESSPEQYRVAEYSAYYRHVKERLEKSISNTHGITTYPEPCEHCDVCRWFRECEKRRRDDDHLSLVAGIRRQHRDQLEVWDVATVAQLAAMQHPLPRDKKPLHGSRESYDRVREQARVQVKARAEEKLIHEPILPIVEKTGFCKLPEPSPGDVFVDLEGDPFVGDSGLQYLFGVATLKPKGLVTQLVTPVYAEEREAIGNPSLPASGCSVEHLQYQKRWAENPAEEKSAFEWFVDLVMARCKEFPAMHVFHFGGYEPGTFKRLMGLYATREEEIDNMLRAGLFIDLHAIFKQALRAGVEEYSLKKLEHFCNFKRTVPLDESRAAMRFITHNLELGWNEEVPEKFTAAMEGYNRDDCFATSALRDWLESERANQIAAGHKIDRPPLVHGTPTEELDARQKRVQALVEKLTADIPVDTSQRDEKQSATWLLAQLLDFHRRENKATWWEGFRLADLDDDELLDERAGLAGLKYVDRIAVDKKIPTDRYSFVKQDTEVRCDKDVYRQGERIGCIVDVDLAALTIDIKKMKKNADSHPPAVYAWDAPIKADKIADSLLRTGDWVLASSIDAPGQFRAVRDLLLCKPPRLLHGEMLAALPGEGPKETACRIVSALDRSIFAIQGPPGAGKTFTGARMICQLVKQGKRVGVTALSHKVIRKLLEEVLKAAVEEGVAQVRCMQKLSEGDDLEVLPGIAVVRDNDAPLAALQQGTANVVGATSWMWPRQEYFESIDALFIDEAGQMALADVVAAGQAARNLILIGDPQQLERPLKGSHPVGADKSALEHLIGDHKTIPADKGMLLPETWRMHPNICEFTSEMFYEARLHPRPTLDQQVLAGHPWMNGAGLWFVPTHHTGCRNSSPQEVEVIKQIIAGLTAPGVEWFWATTNSKPMTLDQVLVVAPYNAQVSDLLTGLPGGARVGTVDKFQGQQAPVVIYSLTTSTPEDAPRGMEFLYSLNRFNVATSRAQTAVIVVGNPRLFEPECKSPRQMQLANAFCAYLERAKTTLESEI
ncbi:MAG TPA: TM0106 family RecB-like putative nuclease [Candidatus Sulfotelmatobacter sp.]|nr:TM0106 family RecB-like putative nuclease [Candidatus Sulfotelmatobacter sp.]